MAKILIIDDDPDIITSVRLSLESAKHQVIAANSGKEGIQKIKEEKPDLIILDVMMETETEGFKIAESIKKAKPNSELAKFKSLPIILLTSIYSTTPLSDEPDISNIPVDLYVDKPINPDDLIGKVEWILSQEKA